MIEWDPSFRRDLDIANWVEDDLRKKYPLLIPAYAELDIGMGWLKILEDWLAQVTALDFNHRQAPVRRAYESNTSFIVDYDTSPWPNSIPVDIKAQIQQLAIAARERSKKICERCGDPGQRQLIRGGIDKHKILCSTCQRMYDNAIFVDEHLPALALAIRDFLRDFRGTKFDYDVEDVDHFIRSRFPGHGRRRGHRLSKIARTEIMYIIFGMKMTRPRWWEIQENQDI